MDPILESFVHNPVMFVIGLILAIGLLIYKKCVLYFSQRGNNIASLVECDYSQATKSQDSAKLLTHLKEKTMTEVKELHGIKETKEAEIMLNDLTFLIKDVLASDGDNSVKVTKIITGILAPDMLAKIVAGVEGAQNIPAELKDISLSEGIELASVELQELAEHLVK